MPNYQHLLTIISHYTILIRQLLIQQGLSQKELQLSLLRLMGAHSQQQLTSILNHKMGIQHHQWEDKLIEIVKVLEQQYSRLTSVDGDIHHHNQNKQQQCPRLVRVKNKRLLLETPRAKRIQQKSEARLQFGLKTPSPKKIVSICKDEFQSDLLDTDETDSRYLDNFQKSIQETLQRTRKLRKFLDGQLRNFKSPQETLYDFEHYDEMLLE